MLRLLKTSRRPARPISFHRSLRAEPLESRLTLSGTTVGDQVPGNRWTSYNLVVSALSPAAVDALLAT